MNNNSQIAANPKEGRLLDNIQGDECTCEECVEDIRADLRRKEKRERAIWQRDADQAMEEAIEALQKEEREWKR